MILKLQFKKKKYQPAALCISKAGELEEQSISDVNLELQNQSLKQKPVWVISSDIRRATMISKIEISRERGL